MGDGWVTQVERGQVAAPPLLHSKAVVIGVRPDQVARDPVEDCGSKVDCHNQADPTAMVWMTDQTAGWEGVFESFLDDPLDLGFC